MKMKMIIKLALALLPFTAVLAQGGVSQRDALQKLDNAVLYQENKGQIVDLNGSLRSDVLFTAGQGSDIAYFRKTGISYVLSQGNFPDEPKAGKDGLPSIEDSERFDREMKNVKVSYHRIDINLIGSNPNPEILKESVAEGFENFYTAYARVANVRSFSKVWYKDVYPQIDMVLYSENGNMKYDFVIHPGGNADDIVLEIDGTQEFQLTDEGLKINSPYGSIIENSPFSYQEEGVEISSDYLLNRNQIKFRIGQYDNTKVLVIDPTRIWGTYNTGSAGNSSTFLRHDVSANASGVVTSHTTQSNGFPVSAGVWDNVYNGAWDLRIAKFDLSGNYLWGTYIGGTGNDYFGSIALKSTNEIVLTGITTNGNFPTTAGAFDQVFNGSECIVAQFNANGGLMWSTFFGGSATEEYCTAVAVNPANEIFVAFNTQSNNVPMIGTPYDAGFNGGFDVVVAKFDAGGNPVWSTYLGGNSNEVVGPNSIQVSLVGDVYVHGITVSNNFPTTAGSFDQTYEGSWDVFVSKLSSTGSTLLASTYVGTNASDGHGAPYVWGGIDLASDGAILLAGSTYQGSIGNLVTAGSFNNTVVASGLYESWLMRLNGTTLGRIWCGSNLNPGNHEMSHDVVEDAAGNIYWFGCSWDNGLNGITTFDALQPNHANPGGQDKFIAQVSADGSTLNYFSYHGSTGDEHWEDGSCAFYGSTLFTAAVTSSPNYDNSLTTAGSYQQAAAGGGWFPYLTAFQFCVPTTLTPDNASLSNATGLCSVTPATPTATDDCGTTVNGVPDVTFPVTTTGTTVVTWTYTSGATSTTQTQNVIVSAPALQTVVPLDQEICPNTSANIQVNGSQVGIDYFLRDDSDNSVVDGPLPGTGSPVIFNTGNIAATTNYNVLATSPGSYGALDFAGGIPSAQYVDLGNSALFDIQGDITVETWVKLDAIRPDWVRLVGKGDFTNRTFGLWVENTGALLWQMYGTTNLDLAGPVLSTGVWYHVAAVRNGNTCEIYLNGVLSASTTYTGTPYLSAAPATLGSNLITHDYLDGQLDEVRIWNTARSGADVAANMNTCLDGTEAGLVANYSMQDGTGSATLVDKTANGLNGTLTNMDPATDWVSGVASCTNCEIQMSAVVTVTVDATAPIAVCQDITVVLDGTGNATIVAADIDGGSTDFCPITLSIPAGLGFDQFDCTTLGANTVTLTVTDDNGNVATCNAIVTVVDNEFPTVTCNNFTAVLDATGNVTITTDDIGGLTAADNCGIASVVASTTSFTCADIGANTVTLTVTDDNGNITTCNATVTVEDNMAPNAICQDITVQLDATGNVSITTAQIDNGSNDACGIASLALDATSFDCSNVSITSSSFGLLFDGVDESITTGNAAFLSNRGAGPFTIESWINTTSTDRDQIVSFGQPGSPNQGAYMYLSNGYLTFDKPFNFGVASTVQVNDGNWHHVAVSYNAGSIQLYIDGVANASVVDPGSFPAGQFTIGGAMSSDPISWSYVGTLDEVRFWNTARTPAEISSNMSVSLTGTEPGLIGYWPIEEGVGSSTADLTGFGGSGTLNNMEGTDWVQGAPPFGAPSVSNVTLTVTDNNGNVSTCIANVTVEDNVAPVAICQDITVQLDASGNATIAPSAIDNGSNDACGIASLALDISTFNCTNIGANTVELTVTDNNGNISTCNATVTVEDNVAPTAICQPFTLQLDASGNGTITTLDIDNGSNDACGIASLALDVTTFDCSNVGANTVVLTVTDNNSNVSTCSAIVTVEDNIDPIAICQDVTIQLDPAGMASITTGDIDNGSNDICGIANLALDITNFSCADVGVNAVVLTVTDNNGNTSTCGANVTVQDTQAPMVVCPSDITLNAVLNNCGRIVTYNMVAVDNCAFTTTQTDGTGYTSGDLFPVGTTLQSYEITDQFGNTTLCSFNVTILDNQNPSITGCPANITANTQAGVCQSTVSWIQPTASDNCPGVVFSSSHAPGSVFALGTTTVTYTATDASGNTNTCTFDVTVQDIESPVFVDCPSDISISNDPGVCEAATLLGSPTVTDNCTLVSVVPSFTGPFPVGTTVVTWTATDNSGNTSTCAQNVNVTDDENPLVACTDITIQLDATGNVSIVAGDINGGASDNCGIATITASQTAFDCSHVGANTVTLTVVDIYGNSSSCDATVTVEDNVDPIALCQSITVQLDASGDATITTAQIDNGSNDACGIAGLSLDITAFDCSDIGANAVVLTVTDNNGNTSTCGATVTVEDNVAPDAICQNITIQLDAAGNASIVATDIDGGSSDACGILSYAADITNFTCTDLGANTVTLTVTDLYSNSSTCTATVTVEDNVAPVADCQDITVQLDATGNVSIAGSDVNGVSTDACGPLTFTVVPNSFTCAEVGVNTVVLTVTDGSGNTSTCTADVTVEDNVAPVVNCSDITVQLDASGNVTIVPGDVVPNMPAGYILDQTGTFAPAAAAGTNVFLGDDAVSGALPVGFNFDFYGNTYTQFYLSSNGFLSFDPAVSQGCCQGGVIPTNDAVNNVIAFDWDDLYPPGGGSLLYQTIGTAPNRQLIVSIVNMPLFPNSTPDVTSQVVLYETSNIIEIHTTQVTSDGSNQTMGIENANGTDGLTVPGRNSALWTASNDYVAFIPVPASGASDACGIASTSVDISTFDCSNVGPNTVTVTVTDVNGNSSTCTSIVTVEDNIAPVAICQDVTVQLDASGNASITDTDINNGSTDACGIASVTVSPSTFNCADLGANTVTLTVTDNNGNVSTCNATVTVEDNIAPTITCPGDVAVVNDPGVCGANVTYTAPTATDNCSATVAQTDLTGLTSGDVFPVGTTTLEYTATDAAGNSNVCSFDVVVTDNEAPIAVCNTITVQLDATGNASIIVADIDGGSTDNCTIATTSIDVTTFDCSNVGSNTVTLTVEDIYGNSSTCASIVTVEDNVDPIAICQDITVQLDAAGMASITTGDIDNGSNDACGISSLGLDITNFSCADVGTNTVILTVEDNNGNSSTCTSTVTVEDNVDPIAICQDITVQLDAAGNVSIVPGDIDNGSSDACGIASITLDIMDFDCSNVGANTVILTVEDNNGNTTTCSSTVTVEDNVAPIANCQDMTAQLDATGNVSITPMDIDNGSSDACGIASITLDVMDFDCSNIGANTVILTVTDVNGNSTTCSSTVTVEDNITPIITCPVDITVSADPGVCDASFVAFGMATAVDNCSLTMTILNNAPAVFPLGNTTVTWTATDAYGNSSSCDQIVTVIDSENPVITCPADVVVSNTAGACSATVAIGTATATDNCGTVTITSDATGTYPVGVTNVTWTATDNAGNSSICVQTITVNDTEAPTIVACAADVTVNTNPGGCFATGVALGSPSATDNCMIASVTNDGLLSYPLGTTVVTWTVTDLAGNTSTCTQNVTVEDNELPMIFCPSNQTVAADLGTCTNSTLSLGTPLVSDNCTASPTVINNAPAVYPLGVTTVTWTVTDASGNSATCNQIITIIDTQNPTIACGGPITIDADLGSCVSTMVVLSSPATFDNCGVASTSNNAPATFPLGNTAVIWTVTDNAGNTATCTQMVTVEDNEAPTIACPTDVTIGTAGGACDVSFVALGTPTTADNCTVASTTNDAPVTYALGTTVVTWTVTDAAGNTATCTQNVTVIDNEAPQINCPADIIIPADAGVCVATGVAIGTATGSDNCTLASIVSDAPATFMLGITTITWTATDAAGNTATCTQTVNVIDNQLPTITCPSDVTTTADAGDCDATGVVLGSPITADNCTVASVTNNAPATFVLGTTTVTWTVVDGSGNSATCNQLVTVTDDELPMIACSADITIGTIAGTCQGSTTLIAPVTSDNCSVASVVNDAPGFYNIGTTSVTWTVTDGSGNVATCVQMVTVEDTEAPTIFCPADITASTDPGMCEAIVALGSPIVNDNCNIASVTNNAPASFPIGTTVVTWTIVDDFGNAATCTQIITVEDNEAPLIVCPADITVNNVPGNCGRSVSYIVPSFMDNCNVTAMTQTDGTGLTSGSWFPIGTTLQEYTVVDEAGNSFSCSFNVIVVDNELPLISNCPADITVYSTANTCDVQVNFGTPVISDNCSGATYTASHFSGEMFPVGLTTVTYTAMDNSGNTAGCSFNITVFDTISPVAPVLASVQGGCSVTLPTPSTTDNCSGTLMGTTTTTFPVTATGITPVTWTFTDANGNTTNVVQYISIDGVVDATVSYSNDVTLVSNNTTPGATYQWIDCNTSLPLPGATNISYVAPVNGSYAVEVTEPGCAPVTSICYTINSVGLDDVSIEDLTVYPNPSTDGIFIIKFEGNIEKVDVLDMLGRIITVPMAYDNKYVDGSELANGKYMLRIYTTNSVTTKEVIIVNK